MGGHDGRWRGCGGRITGSAVEVSDNWNGIMKPILPFKLLPYLSS